MASPLTEFRAHVKGLVQTEFAAEGFPVYDDKLHESMGHEGAVAGVYPEYEMLHENGMTQRLFVAVQVFRRYTLEVNPEQRVDPAKIEDWSWRLQRRFKDELSPGFGGPERTGFFTVARIDYPDDPTGNKSRFVMLLMGHGDAGSLAETLA